MRDDLISYVNEIANECDHRYSDGIDAMAIALWVLILVVKFVIRHLINMYKIIENEDPKYPNLQCKLVKIILNYNFVIGFLYSKEVGKDIVKILNKHGNLEKI